MSTTETSSGEVLEAPAAGTVEYHLEVLTIPVSDVDRAKAFYAKLGWREDADFPIREGFRVIQMTPPGSKTSVIFGEGVTGAAPGSYEGLALVVYDIEAAHADLVARGAEVSDIWHGRSGWDRFGDDAARLPGRDPQGNSYTSWLSFKDPDGNTWLLQEIKTRLPGR
jgi:catechol 2,3-dioxygenase-like lactoylglutathione lyase family enzyme